MKIFWLISESIQCLDVETKHLATFTGDKPLGASWTDKVMAMKDSGDASVSDAQQGDGAEDDEWVWIYLKFGFEKMSARW